MPNAKDKKGTGPRIDYRDTPTDKTVSRPFPAKVTHEYRVYISPDAYRRMRDHAAISDEVELCGVLVGDICRDDQGVYLNVTGAIEGEGANTYGTQVTFTQQTWDHIHQVRERDYPNAQIVGWFHTHPGFGVFLSGMDTFIHENFFNAPHQIAVVLETKTKEEGCFGWVNGEITALRRYWVGDREVRLATGEAEPFDESKCSRSEPEERRAVTVVSGNNDEPQGPVGVIGLVIIAVLCAAFGIFWGQSMGRKATLQALQTEFYSLLEFTSLNAAADQDLSAAEKAVADVRGAIAKSGAPEDVEKLEQVEKLIEGFRKDYTNRDRAGFRKRLNQVVAKRQTLGERVDDAARMAYELRMSIVDLYMLRVQDLLRESNTRTIDGMSKENAYLVRQLVERMLTIEPAFKDVLARTFPELFRSLYPSPAPKEAPAKDGEKAPSDAGKKEK